MLEWPGNIVEAAYRWRAAEVHLGALAIGLRRGNKEAAGEEVEKTLRQLRIEIDSLHSEAKG